MKWLINVLIIVTIFGILSVFLLAVDMVHRVWHGKPPVDDPFPWDQSDFDEWEGK